MDFQDAKNIILQSENICIIPEENSDPEAIASALSLFYTLKELGKNVNLIIEKLPEWLDFLTPSLNFISYPKNFVISVPSKSAEISQIYYEKNDDSLKIHLTVEKGFVKKDDIAFYFSEKKPDLIITVGVKDYHSQLSGKLNPFGFLLGAQILNIDNSQDNKKFGKINLVESLSLTQLAVKIIKDLDSPVSKETATCLLAGLIIYTDNFKNFNITAEVFETAAFLMKSGGDLKEIVNNIQKRK